ncbi:MAG TPA: hemolysin D, partial [Planctomycetaceae bacterium]|nr:hemolysin D [Planctomycetaceae bacterium]
WLTRYVLPGVLLLGFLALVGWAARDTLFPPRPVTVVPVFATSSSVRAAETPLFHAAGWIEPRPTAIRVAALAPGVVEQLLVVEDQPVRAGEPVAHLIRDDAQLAYERAVADVKLREAERREAEAAGEAARTRHEQPVHLEASLAEAEAALARIETELKNLPFAVRRAEAESKLAESDYQGKLAAKGVVAEVKIDEARRTLDSAKALVEELHLRESSLEAEKTALVRRRNSLKTQLALLADEIKARDEAEARVQAAAARIEQAQVAAAEAKLRLDRMTVRSPSAGRVYQLIADPGTTLSGGMGAGGYDGSTVVTLYRPEMLQVRVDVRFEDIPKVSLGQPARIDNPALPEPLTGRVLFVSSVADIQKNTLEVKVEIDSPPPVFKPDMLVDVMFLSPERPESEPAEAMQTRFYVSESCIHQDDVGTHVWLADQSQGVARRTPVEVGAASADGLVEITGGLTMSSRVITGSTEGLRDGQRIRVTAEAPLLDAGPSGAGSRRTQLKRLPQGEHE